VELQWFNEEFFNDRDPPVSYPYVLRNQFANPIVLYDRPEDIDLYELFYCEGSTPSDEEVRSILDTGPGGLPCPAFKLTAAEMDALLKANTGLTAAETAKKGLDGFTYDETSDAYYWIHGDTNYCGDLDFLYGTREKTGGTKLVKLYHNSSYAGSGWYCVTLSEQGDGEYWFVSNQTCGHPAIPPVLPSGEPEVTISLKDLEPYVAEAVTVEHRSAEDYHGGHEDRLDNWDLDGHHVSAYLGGDGMVRAAVERADGNFDVFLTVKDGEYGNISPFSGLFGHDGFYVRYNGATPGDYYKGGEGGSYGTIYEYFYFDESGALTRLLRLPWSSPKPLDLDGDGTDELSCSGGFFFQRDGLIYRADWAPLLLEACPELGHWDWGRWDPYGRFQYANGLTDWVEGRGAAMWERYLCFDGENILVYRPEKSISDHMAEGVDAGVPPEVVKQAKAQIAALLKDDGEGAYRFADNDEYDLPVDDWRLDRLSGPETFPLGNAVIEVWSYGGMVHTTDPKKFVWAGGNYMDEDGWCAIDHSDFYGQLVYQMEGEDRTFLFTAHYDGAELESIGGREQFYQDLEGHGVDVSPSSYAALEAALHIEDLSYGGEVTVQPVGGSARTFLLDEEGMQALAGLTDPEKVMWTRAEAPAQEPAGDSVILRDSNWYDMLQFWSDSDLVMYKNANRPEAVWYLAQSRRDDSGAHSRPYPQVRHLYDEAAQDRQRTAAG